MSLQQQKRSTGQKTFQCQGYGTCTMSFSRSEHLARHIRKHTGEKPFSCIVPDCNRRFSRYDNMMQHTHTHDNRRRRKKDVHAVTIVTWVALALCIW
ncbi:hypothetical protein BDF14DRAFT_1725485 [Spinellus fusiger]|nr:hypothetical protein BDF14DRAFT_1725485 [Spinellus fusiger]